MLLAKTAKSRVVPPFGGLGVTYMVHLWFAGKRMVDFLLVLVQLYSPALMVEELWADIGQNRSVRRGLVTFIANFRNRGVAHQRLLASENYSPWAITWHCLRDPTFSRFDTISAYDRQTHWNTHDDSKYRDRIASCRQNVVSYKYVSMTLEVMVNDKVHLQCYADQNFSSYISQAGICHICTLLAVNMSIFYLLHTHKNT